MFPVGLWSPHFQWAICRDGALQCCWRRPAAERARSRAPPGREEPSARSRLHRGSTPLAVAHRSTPVSTPPQSIGCVRNVSPPPGNLTAPSWRSAWLGGSCHGA